MWVFTNDIFDIFLHFHLAVSSDAFISTLCDVLGSIEHRLIGRSANESQFSTTEKHKKPSVQVVSFVCVFTNDNFDIFLHFQLAVSSDAFISTLCDVLRSIEHRLIVRSANESQFYTTEKH